MAMRAVGQHEDDSVQILHKDIDPIVDTRHELSRLGVTFIEPVVEGTLHPGS